MREVSVPAERLGLDEWVCEQSVRYEHHQPTSAGPIGTRIAVWRLSRGLTHPELASLSGLHPGQIADWESGIAWVDRRGHVAALASALHLDVADLTGQPYAPVGEEHVRSCPTTWCRGSCPWPGWVAGPQSKVWVPSRCDLRSDTPSQSDWP